MSRENRAVPRSAAETRSHLLDVAADLFYWKGIRATGVDVIAARAGVAPTTLFRLFRSKDELVGAYVERADQEVRDMVAAAISNAGPDARDQILAFFDTVIDLVNSDHFRGCAMMMTLAEFPDQDLPAHRNAVAGKEWVRKLLGELTDRLGLADPAAVADQLVLVMEGLLASSQALGPNGPARQARRLAEAILTTAPTG